MAKPTKIPVFDIVPPKKSEDLDKEEQNLYYQKEQEESEKEEKETPYIHPKESFLQKLAKEKNKKILHWPDKASKPYNKIIKLALVILIPGLLIFSGVAIGLLKFSKAKITIVTDQAFYPFSFEVNFDSKISNPDLNAKRVPVIVQKKTLGIKKEFPSTGESLITSKAKGKVTIFNNYISAQTLVANTRLESPDGKIFRITSRLVVPANGNVVVDVIADQAGPDYNINPTKFTIPGLKGLPQYEKIYAQSYEAFKGGASGKTKVVTQEDINSAQKSLTDEILEELKKEIKKSTINDNIFLGEGLTRFSINSMTVSVKPQDPVESFEVKIDATLEAMVFDKKYIVEIAKKEIPAEILDALHSPEFEFAFSISKPADFAAGTFSLKVDGTINVAKSLNPNAIKKMLAGKSDLEIRKELISLPGIKEVKIKLWPKWARNIPSLPDRIEVNIM